MRKVALAVPNSREEGGESRCYLPANLSGHFLMLAVLPAALPGPEPVAATGSYAATGSGLDQVIMQAQLRMSVSGGLLAAAGVPAWLQPGGWLSRP